MQMSRLPKLQTAKRPDSARTQETRNTTAPDGASSFSVTHSYISRDQPNFGDYVNSLPPLPAIKEVEIEEKKKIYSKPQIVSKRGGSNHHRGSKPSLVQVKARNSISRVPDTLTTNESQVSTASKGRIVEKMKRTYNAEPRDQQKTKKPQVAVAVAVAVAAAAGAEARRPQITKQQERINYAAFTKVDPLAPKRNVKQTETRQQKKQQIAETASGKESVLDKSLLTQLEEYVTQTQIRNSEVLPDDYDLVIEEGARRVKNNLQGLQALNFSECRGQFSDGMMQVAARQIQKNNIKLEEEASQKPAAKADESIGDDEIMLLSQSSFYDSQKRNNLFLTEILKGRLQRESISQLEEMQKTHLKLIKLEQQSESDSEEEQSPRSPSKNNGFIQRNIIQAAGGLYQECDYLPEAQKRRLAQLMSQIETGANLTEDPFLKSVEEMEHLNRLERGIELYRSLNQYESDRQESIYATPARMIENLQNQMRSINDRLISIQSINSSIQEIKKLAEKLREQGVRPPRSELLDLKVKQFEDAKMQLQQAESILNNSESSKADLQLAFNEVHKKLGVLEDELRTLQKMSEEEFAEAQKKKLDEARADMDRLLHQTQGIDLESLQQCLSNMRQKLIQEQQEQRIEITPIELGGLNPQETIQQMDARFQQLLNKQKSGNVGESPPKN